MTLDSNVCAVSIVGSRQRWLRVILVTAAPLAFEKGKARRRVDVELTHIKS